MKQPADEIQPSGEKMDMTSKSPLVFISHDTRDAELAESFSKLLSSVSAGVLKSFRSSDKKGPQGIEYGFEWYPEIMKKLDEATDVVCLLTQNSINRPWILYEAGVAKGKLNTPLLGISLGVPLGQVNIGPFAQFQNCADDEDSLSKLVVQLVNRIPNSEPDIDVIKTQVSVFIIKSKEIFSKHEKSKKNDVSIKSQDQALNIAKLFEEIKLMYSELPERIDRRVQPINRRATPYRFNTGMLEELLHVPRYKSVGFLIVLGLLKNDLPWIYDSGIELYRQIRNISQNEINKKRINYLLIKAIGEFKESIEITFRLPMMRELCRNSNILRDHDELFYLLMDFAERLQHEYKMEDQMCIEDDNLSLTNIIEK